MVIGRGGGELWGANDEVSFYARVLWPSTSRSQFPAPVLFIHWGVADHPSGSTAEHCRHGSCPVGSGLRNPSTDEPECSRSGSPMSCSQRVGPKTTVSLGPSAELEAQPQARSRTWPVGGRLQSLPSLQELP